MDILPDAIVFSCLLSGIPDLVSVFNFHVVVFVQFSVKEGCT